MVSVGGQGGFSILIITVTAQRVCMPAQKKKSTQNAVRAYAKHQLTFLCVSLTQLSHCHIERTGTHCGVWKGLEDLASRCIFGYTHS